MYVVNGAAAVETRKAAVSGTVTYAGPPASTAASATGTDVVATASPTGSPVAGALLYKATRSESVGGDACARARASVTDARA